MIGVVELVVLALGAGVAVAGYAGSVPLPSEPVVPQASVLYYRDGQTELARLGVTSRQDVSLDQVPVPVRQAVLAAEDRSFHDHPGVSWRGLTRAVVRNVADGAAQGASTITQQYVRNAYLTQERTAERKAKEIVLALKIERRYRKDEILERYLNTIYFGRGAYGIGAAAHAYFGVGVDRLSVEQGAVLASVIKDPYHFDPAVDPAGAADRWRWVLTAMSELGWIEAGAVAAARYPEITPEAPGPAALAGPLGQIVDQVERELAALGVSAQSLRTAGLTVVTHIDEQVQTAALDRVAATLKDQPKGLRAALVAVEPATGAVRGYYGGSRGVGYFDDALAPRAPGAAFRPVVLATGLIKGISAGSIWDGRSPRSFRDRGGVPLYNRDNEQCPVCSLDFAMLRSLNTPYYALAEAVGPESVRELAVRIGVPQKYQGRRSLVDEPGAPAPGSTRADIALGRYPVAPADLASVYATFAAEGVHAQRRFVDRVISADGRHWAVPPARRAQVLPPAVAAELTAVLAKVVAVHTPVRERPAAGMFGTVGFGDTVESQEAWMAGYTGDLAAVVWLGQAEPGPLRDRAKRPIRGEGMAAELWRDFLAAALQGRPVAALPGAVGDDQRISYRAGGPDQAAGDRADRQARERRTGGQQDPGRLVERQDEQKPNPEPTGPPSDAPSGATPPKDPSRPTSPATAGPAAVDPAAPVR
ncbi:transglycosylase domain-containing protein [Solwaraspora sp. WMMD1047]|uniref:transglycosylase domain-containing protein n=1 Tax=Solwaraspora sp. WMMD1047 TaxID=3016102 RepID=UPI002417D0B0|nr:transglycosylase domain-containing protein [Solwaraspora sp. WMMD1047]MDG4834673.1 transglycosylase domain-containing protein [Solwaraspora sp. WMMD1047]